MSCSFVHCNGCFCRPSKNFDFFLTSCLHLYCANCLSKDPLCNGICLICKNNFKQVKLSGNMSDEVKQFFADPHKLFNKYLQVMKFQNGHLQRYASHCEVEIKKLKAENLRYRKREEEFRRALKEKETKLSRGRINATQPTFQTQSFTVKREPEDDCEFIPFNSNTQPAMYSRPAYPASQGFQMSSSRVSLEPNGNNYFRRQGNPSSINLKSMSASSSSSYYSAENVYPTQKAEVPPFRYCKK